MKKSTAVVSVVVALAVIYTGSSWYVGRRAESVVRQAITSDNQLIANSLGAGGPSAKLAVESYQRGIFSSDAVYSLTVEDKQGKTTEIKLADHLDHGPFPFSQVRRGDFRPVMVVSRAQLLPTAATQQWFDTRTDKTQAPVTSLTTLLFSGTGHSAWRFQPFNASKGGSTFSGGTVTVDLSNRFRDKVTTAAFDDFRMKDESGELHAQHVKIDSQSSATDSSNAKAKSTVSIGTFTLVSTDNQPLTVNGWRLVLDGALVNGLFGGAAHYQFEHILSGQANLGSLAIAATVSHLDVKALDAVNEAYRQARGKDGSTPALNQALQEKTLAFLATEPAVSIDNIQWKTPKGESTLKANLQLTKPDLAQAGDALQSLLGAMKVLNVDASVSKPMVVNLLTLGPSGETLDEGAASAFVDQSAARLIETGLVRVDGDKLLSDIHYQGGQVELNGNKMSVNEFLMRAVMSFMR